MSAILPLPIFDPSQLTPRMSLIAGGSFFSPSERFSRILNVRKLSFRLSFWPFGSRSFPSTPCFFNSFREAASGVMSTDQYGPLSYFGRPSCGRALPTIFAQLSSPRMTKYSSLFAMLILFLTYARGKRLSPSYEYYTTFRPVCQVKNRPPDEIIRPYRGVSSGVLSASCPDATPLALPSSRRTRRRRWRRRQKDHRLL